MIYSEGFFDVRWNVGAMGNVLLEAEEGVLKLTATDTQVGLVARYAAEVGCPPGALGTPSDGASVLVGDFLYSRSFEMMVSVGSMRVMEILSTTTNVIAEGEVLQLLNCHDPDTTEDLYRDVIRYKTAKLFEASAQLGAVLGNQPQAIERAMASYGMHLGTAFQLIDDALDYGSSGGDIGKNIGDDLAEGKPTLPLIRAIELSPANTRDMLRRVMKS